MENLEVRLTVSAAGLTYRAIAKEIGVSPEYLSKIMGKKLSTKNRIRILNAINALLGAEKHDI